ncbi:MAG: hypothetical protein AMXMBFR58_01760 [Phycisphaerae bacterium]
MFNGKTPAKPEQRREGHPVLKIRDLDESGMFRGSFDSYVDPELASEFSEKWLRIGDTLILNAAHNADYVGSKTAYVTKEIAGSLPTGEWLVIRARDGVADPLYLRYLTTAGPALRAIRALVKGIHLYPSDVARVPVELPSLAEQKRIAAILDKADAIRRRRQEAARLADTLIPSVFYEMFGDPVTNPKGWPVVEMEQLFSRSPNYGSMQVPTTSPGPDSWLDLRVINIQDGHLDLTDKKYISLDDDMVERHGVLDGDLLLARAIGSPEQLGKCIIARPGQQRWAFDSHLMRVRFNRARALPEFIHAYLTSSGGRHEFLKHTRRSAVQFNINTKEIACVRVTLPPISAQQRFLDVLKQTTHNRARSDNLAAEGDALFNSLVQRAFRGEL